VRAAMAACGEDSAVARTGPGVHAVAHITGGGFEGNIPRALPDGLRAVLDRGTWEVPGVFTEIRRLGRVTDAEMCRVFNLGLGMVMMVDPGCVDDALGALGAAGVDARVVGTVREGSRGVDLVGPELWPS
jgi:phosphoribosylformylglycinamidine cyclo-ligase